MCEFNLPGPPNQSRQSRLLSQTQSVAPRTRSQSRVSFGLPASGSLSRQLKRISSLSAKQYSVQRLSFGRSFVQTKLVRTYQPTYQLNSRKSFSVEKVDKLLKRIVDAELDEVEYSDKLVPEICLTLAEMIRTAVKEEKYDRYRIIVAVSIGQRRNQGVHVFHSFLWDADRDAFTSYNYENCHLFANVVVYGIYLD